MKLDFENKKICESFEPLKENSDNSFIETAILIEREAKIENHPFFSFAKENKEAMILWASQEAIVTNPFSQVLFHLIGNISNVHIRSILLPVVFGEHSNIRKGKADLSHPWLIWRLCDSLKINPKEIVASKAVINFIRVLEDSAENPMYSLGVLGIGNELMLLAEYGAVMKCFDSTFPEADYQDFLEANIGEDEIHSKIMGDAAVAMASLGYERQDFIKGAVDGVSARIKYYDELLAGIS